MYTTVKRYVTTLDDPTGPAYGARVVREVSSATSLCGVCLTDLRQPRKSRVSSCFACRMYVHVHCSTFAPYIRTCDDCMAEVNPGNAPYSP